ncbi:MAG: hypothetical protein GXN96_04240 [Aquificae bacterium]|nr:hypothetical protein [Aquificota bacterium]
MNYAPLILERVREEEGEVEITLVAGAPPVVKRGKVLEELAPSLLKPSDIKETLISLREQAPSQQRLDPFRGMFSFGLEGVGRVRVVYFVQRGSLVLSVLKTPFRPPKLLELLENYPEVGGELRRALTTNSLTCVMGPSKKITGEFLASLVTYMGERHRRIFYTLERPLYFLLKHGPSVFIQREVGTDLSSLREGLMDALAFFPDCVVVNDALTSDAELLKLVAEFYPFPFPLLFSVTGSSREDFFRFLDSAGRRELLEILSQVWLLRPSGNRLILERIKGERSFS